MVAARLALLVLSAALLAAAAAAAAVPAPVPAQARVRRQLDAADDNTLQPLDNGAMWRLPIATNPSGSAARRRTERSMDTLDTSSLRTRQLQSSDTLSGASSSSTYHTRRGPRQVTRQATTKPTDDIPVFDRNKVSLEFPGSLFGPSVSLLIRSTKLVGDVVQNSAVRYQSFLRLFRPLFRGPFEIKGLDPPTTTTTRRTTTTRVTSTTPVPAADNEINRRR